jgi:hypothetical protein
VLLLYDSPWSVQDGKKKEKEDKNSGESKQQVLKSVARV